MNIFQLNYDTRLKSWHELRARLENSDVEHKCIEIDRFWQQCPLVNHYLHPSDIKDWPSPWELLYENSYCYYARALGIVYTLLLLGTKDIDLVEARDNNNEDVVLVFVNNAKYICNYWPDTILNNCLQDFKITRYIDLTHIITKIGTK